MKPRAVFDIECYANYFLVCFEDINTGRRKHFEMYEGRPLDTRGVLTILRNFTLIGFNSNNFDVPMLRLALRIGVTNKELKALCDSIILRNLKPWDCERQFNLPKLPWLDVIDIIEPMPSVQVGLKLYGGRLHSKRLQDLPIEPDALIEPEQRDTLVHYCYNDLQTTIDCYRHIEPQMELRCQMSEQYGVDLRSKSDAQIAEAVIKHEIERITGDVVSKPSFPHDYTFKYVPPTFLSFTSDVMQEMFDKVLNETFYLDHKGDVKMPKSLESAKIRIGNSVYRMGIGGLHSSESKATYVTDEDWIIRDADVASFYPTIMLNCELFPDHLGRHFLDVFSSIRQRRIAAKHSKDKVTDMTLKIVLNGTYGKLGSKWSFLYSPNLMIQVTLTGQLALLMLIEELEAKGIQVVSANTDGIVSRIRRDDEGMYHTIIKQWERKTNFEMEFADYASLNSRDVNNYIAVKPDGKVKQKGAYAFVGSKGSPAEKNPSNYICIDAVVNYLTKGTPLEETIEWCPDIRRFLTIRRVTGGAVDTYDDGYLGKTVRWYHSKHRKTYLAYRNNGNKVPKSDGARPLMTLDGSLPDDIDYDYYIGECRLMLGQLGVL